MNVFVCRRFSLFINDHRFEWHALVTLEEKLAEDVFFTIFSCVEIANHKYIHVQSFEYAEERNLEFHSLVTKTSMSTSQ